MFNRKAFIGYTLGPDGDQTIFARLASLAFPNVAENQAATDQFGAIVYSAPSPFTEGDTLNKMSDADLAAIIPHGGLALNTSTHFVSYSAPAMIAFRKQAYLEFSLNTTLRASAAGSHYKMAALAFDDHVAHLVRPVMAYFKGDLDFDGIAFSTTIHQADKSASTQGNEAVEFFLPTAALRCYETYDCTGQQLIDQGSVLINGERVSLDLQTAEASGR